MITQFRNGIAVLALAMAAVACGGDDTAPASATTTGTGGGDPPVPAGCDPLSLALCALPFPNDLYLEDDPSTATGKRVSLPPEAVPLAASRTEPPSIDAISRSDGFSAGATILVHVPDATVDGFATPVDIDASLADSSPTVLLAAATGERVPHFAELDRSHDDDARRALMIKPVVRLGDATRYIVALRGVRDASGALVKPPAAFVALRDGLAYPHPSIDARRARYDEIFATLEAAGIPRAELQLAWEFSTASQKSNTDWLLHMRDHALAQVGDAGPPYTIDAVDDDVSEFVARRILGHITVPLYLDKPEAGGVLVFGDDGLPKQNGTADYSFVVLVPKSVVASGVPAPPVAHGHGLLGSHEQVEGSAITSFADEFGYVAFGTSWIGMSSDDGTSISDLIAEGELGQFRQVPDRLSQGVINALLMMRLMRGAMATDPATQFNGVSAIDPSQGFYMGDSQGGIMGATYMALSTDVTRGVLGVPGQPYSLLLDRSVDFALFFAVLKIAYPDPLDQQLLIALAQMMWDRAEPTGFSAHIGADVLPGTPEHRVLLEVAIGDHQVTTLGAHVMARTVGAKSIAPAARPIWGVEEATGPYAGSAIVEHDFGLPAEPIENVPMMAGDDPHGKPRQLPAARARRDAFFRTGTVDTFCDGPCDPE